MKIKRISDLNGKENTMDLEITKEQIELFEEGVPPQDAFPDLTSGEVEFLKTGVKPEDIENRLNRNDKIK